jgi:ribose transport system substrate-binding protein
MVLSKRFLSVMAAAVIVAGACSSSSATTAPTSGGGASSSATTAPTSGGGASSDKLTIGVINFSSTDVATVNQVKGIQQAADALGWTVKVVDAKGSVDVGNTAMEDFVQAKVDAIMEIVLPAASLGAGMAAAKAAGIPVISMGGGMVDGVAALVDDFQGDVVADALLKATGGKGEVLAILYKEGLPCRERYTSLLNKAGSYPELSMITQNVPVPGQSEASTAAALAWIQAHPKGVAMWGCFDDLAMGAIGAEKQLGLAAGTYKVFSFNGDTGAIQAVIDGWMTSTLWIDHLKMGADGVGAIKQIRAAGASWVPKTFPTTVINVSADNIQQFTKDHPEWNAK